MDIAFIISYLEAFLSNFVALYMVVTEKESQTDRGKKGQRKERQRNIYLIFYIFPSASLVGLQKGRETGNKKRETQTDTGKKGQRKERQKKIYLICFV